MIYLFYGEDTFSIQSEIDEISKSDDFEISVFENGNIDDFSNKLVPQSFFTKKRIFIAKSVFIKLEIQKDQKNILKALENLPADTNIIFVETRQPKVNPVLTFIKKNGTIKNFSSGRSADLIGFIKSRVKENGGDIAPLAAERLASFVGGDLWQLSREIDKLVLYKMGDELNSTIETADVDFLVKANFEANIFALMDSISAKNTKKSIELLNSFLDSGENAIYILTMIERQFKNIAFAKFEKNITESTLAKKAGLHPFVAKKSLEQAKNFTQTEIIEMYEKLIWSDLKLKSGFDQNQILQRLLI